MARLFAAVLSCIGAVVALGPPGQYFPVLTQFSLQTPYPSGGGVEIIKQPALMTYNDSVFYAGTLSSGTLAMFFWTPEDGAHTSGSKYPRSELSENILWTFSGTNVMNASVTVMEVPAGDSITIGQVHLNGVSGSCSICIELEWSAGDIIAHYRDSSCGSQKQTVGTGYKIGDVVNYELTIIGTQASAKTGTGSYSWDAGSWQPKAPLYFKVGNYLQVAGTSKTVGSVVAVSHISVSHK